MAIRFRCVYCDKLLGIATRKAGTVVNCPQCSQPLIVPSPEPAVVPKPAAAPQPAASTPRAAVPAPAPVPPPPRTHVPAGNLFEQDDFDVILEPEATVQSPAQPVHPRPTAPAPQPLPARTFPATQDLPVPNLARGYAPVPVPAPIVMDTAGWVLTGPRLAFALLGVGFLVLISFGLGLLIGRML